jgi:regulator of sigma E protease
LLIPVAIDFKRKQLFDKYGYLGISPQFTWPDRFIRHIQYGPIAALSHAKQNTVDFIYLNFLLLGKMITGKVSLLSLGGPISIFQGAGTAVHTGVLPFFSFVAFLSIAIGVINILPIPGLDGGHLLFYGIEMIMRRPVSPALQMLFIRFGLIILMLIMVQAISNDIMRLY